MECLRSIAERSCRIADSRSRSTGRAAARRDRRTGGRDRPGSPGRYTASATRIRRRRRRHCVPSRKPCGLPAAFSPIAAFANCVEHVATFTVTDPLAPRERLPTARCRRKTRCAGSFCPGRSIRPRPPVGIALRRHQGSISACRLRWAGGAPLHASDDDGAESRAYVVALTARIVTVECVPGWGLRGRRGVACRRPPCSCPDSGGSRFAGT
jgi:hypothetical protein